MASPVLFSIQFGQVGATFTLDHFLLVKVAYPTIDLNEAMGPLCVAMTAKLRENSPQADDISAVELSFEAEFFGDVD